MGAEMLMKAFYKRGEMPERGRGNLCRRHCERSEAIQPYSHVLDCFASLAM